jgi:hypothetical protein
MSDCLTSRFVVTPDEIFDEQGNICGSLAERWNKNWNNIESVKKIPAESFGSNGSSQIPISGRYEPDVY